MHLSLSIRARMFVSLILIALVSAAGLSWYFLAQMEALGLRTLEERLAGKATVTAALVAEAGFGREGALHSALTQVDLGSSSRMQVLDGSGIALADSAGEGVLQTDYSERTEVREALAGGYGTLVRTTDGDQTMFVALPIHSEGQVVGVAYASAPTVPVAALIDEHRAQLAWAFGLFMLGALALAEVFSRWHTRPLRYLASGTAAFAAGDFGVRLQPVGARETRALAEVFNAMADRVERVVAELTAEERRTSRFVSDVSHELRTPLTAIRGAAETLLDGGMSEHDAARFLATIVRESDRLTRLANDLLALQRIEGATGELPLRRVDLAVVVERALAALQPLLDVRNATLTVSGTAPWVLGDPDRLQQVVANLVDNATRLAEHSTVRIELSRSGGTAVLSVLDTGPGIPEEDIEQLFDRFYRTQASRDRSTGGSGLGLPIVKAIATAHAGTIEAANRPGGGARFTLRLPALPE